MPLFENHVGISVSINKIRLVELVYTENEFFLENIDEENFEEDLLPNFIDKNFFNVLHKSFQQILSRISISSKNVSFSLDPEFFQIFHVPFDTTLLKRDLIDHLKWELSKIKPSLNSGNYILQNIELKKVDESGYNQTAVLALHRNYFNSLIEFCKENKLDLKFVDYSHTASNNLLRFIKAIKGLSGLSVFKSSHDYSFMILDDFIPTSLIKKESVQHDTYLADVKTKINELVGHRSGLSGFLFSFITGSTIKKADIDSLNKMFDLNFKILDPFAVIKTSETFSSSINIQENTNEFTSAVGVALRLF